LHPEQSLAAAVTDGSGDTVMVAGKPRHVMNYLQDFLFTPQQARTPVKVLSGGERARLLLAKLFAAPSNFLVLDEPTNDLDLETLDLLEEVIADYPGTALLVSHDRDFLDRVATGIVLAEGDGRFTEYAGGYSDMLAQRSGKVEQTAPTRKEPAKAPSKEFGEKRPRTSAPKMNFADAHALKILPEKIAAAELKMAVLEQRLSDSGLYARDPALFNKLSAELAEIRAQKDADEERWLTLEMEREALDEAAGGEQPS
jgi:ATP-binding cassette subfamily F protein uup